MGDFPHAIFHDLDLWFEPTSDVCLSLSLSPSLVGFFGFWWLIFFGVNSLVNTLRKSVFLLIGSNPLVLEIKFILNRSMVFHPRIVNY
jgi:hypothetical protein